MVPGIKTGEIHTLIMIIVETGGKCITVVFYIRVLSRCLSAPPPPLSPHVSVWGCPIPTKPTQTAQTHALRSPSSSRLPLASPRGNKRPWPGSQVSRWLKINTQRLKPTKHTTDRPTNPRPIRDVIILCKSWWLVGWMEGGGIIPRSQVSP